MHESLSAESGILEKYARRLEYSPFASKRAEADRFLNVYFVEPKRHTQVGQQDIAEKVWKGCSLVCGDEGSGKTALVRNVQQTCEFSTLEQGCKVVFASIRVGFTNWQEDLDRSIEYAIEDSLLKLGRLNRRIEEKNLMFLVDVQESEKGYPQGVVDLLGSVADWYSGFRNGFSKEDLGIDNAALLVCLPLGLEQTVLTVRELRNLEPAQMILEWNTAGLAQIVKERLRFAFDHNHIQIPPENNEILSLDTIMQILKQNEVSTPRGALALFNGIIQKLRESRQ